MIGWLNSRAQRRLHYVVELQRDGVMAEHMQTKRLRLCMNGVSSSFGCPRPLHHTSGLPLYFSFSWHASSGIGESFPIFFPFK